jgi:hypothetical protein
VGLWATELPSLENDGSGREAADGADQVIDSYAPMTVVPTTNSIDRKLTLLESGLILPTRATKRLSNQLKF